MKTRTHFIVIVVLLTFHAFADVYFYISAFPHYDYYGVETILDLGGLGGLYNFHLNDLRVMAIFGFFMGQASLLSLWADRFPIKSYLRIPLALLGVVCLCYIISRYSSEMPLIDKMSTADYYFFYGIHALSIIIILTAFRIGKILIQWMKKEETETNAENAQFSIGFMLIWTAIIALILGMGKLFLIKPIGFSPCRFRDFFITIGACNAIFSLPAFIIILIKTKRRWLFLISSLIIFLALLQPLSWLEIYVIEYDNIPLLELRVPRVAWGMPMGIGFMLLANIQILTIFGTLLPLRCFGLLGENRKEGIDPAIPKADAIANESP